MLRHTLGNGLSVRTWNRKQFLRYLQPLDLCTLGSYISEFGPFANSRLSFVLTYMVHVSTIARKMLAEKWWRTSLPVESDPRFQGRGTNIRDAPERSNPSELECIGLTVLLES